MREDYLMHLGVVEDRSLRDYTEAVCQSSPDDEPPPTSGRFRLPFFGATLSGRTLPLVLPGSPRGCAGLLDVLRRVLSAFPPFMVLFPAIVDVEGARTNYNVRPPEITNFHLAG